MQDGASIVWSIALYEDSLLLTSSNDIVQKDIQTGAIQRTFRVHKKPIYSFIVTEDSRMISSAYDDMIIVWDLETGSILKRIWLRSSGTRIRSIYLQDERVFMGGLDGEVRQIDLLSGKVVRTTSLNSEVYCVVADANSLYIGRYIFPYGLKLNIESGAIILSFDEHSEAIYSIFLLNGLLFSASGDTRIICWDTMNGEIIRSYVGHSSIVISIAIFDGELYSAGSGLELFKWNVNDGLITKKFLFVRSRDIQCLSYRSQNLFTGSTDTTVIRWNAVSGEQLLIYAGRNSKLRSVVSWKNFIISGGEDGEIRMWDASIESIDPFAVVDNRGAIIACLYLFEDYLYSGDVFGDIKQISLISLALIRTFAVTGDTISSLAANKFLLYAGGYFGSIYQWNTSSETQAAKFSAHSSLISSLQLTDDYLYSGSYDSIAKAWNAKSLDIVGVFAATNAILAISIEHEFLLACTTESVEKFSVISAETNVLVKELSVCYSIVSRENIAYTGHQNSFIRARNLFSLVSYETYTGHLDSITTLCFDEVFNLYSAGFDGTIKKWNLASRRVAFSFENKNGSVSVLAVDQDQLFVGLKSGRIDCFNTETARSLASLRYHTNAVSSLNAFNGSTYSSGLDGRVSKFSSNGDRNFTPVYRSDHEPLKDLSLGSLFWIALQGDSKIVFIPMNSNSESVKVIDFKMPLSCIAATESVLLAGSQSGIIYAWNIGALQLNFELKGHVSPVNNLLVADYRLFSASDDKTVIEWSLESQTIRKTYERLSASALGHLGPVNALSICTSVLFSAGSDNTVRRWNTQTGKHEDVYFGFTKSVTSVVCYNGSVFAGSEDFSVLMFKPSLPESQDATVKSSTTIMKRNTNKKRITRLKNAAGSTINVTQVLVSVSIVL
ncbi:hypothetical protein MP638_001221, partial [Amoeboaphelidium occidentale]